MVTGADIPQITWKYHILSMAFWVGEGGRIFGRDMAVFRYDCCTIFPHMLLYFNINWGKENTNGATSSGTTNIINQT